MRRKKKSIYNFHEEKNQHARGFKNKKKSAFDNFLEKKSTRKKFYEQNLFREEKKSMYKFYEEIK